ncbi:MAG: cupredoxin domain-containing protein [Bdellovibrionales bacterium]|nr:cupredoxin domain-containing protein [Bdellovibrionales bacterium]
MKKLILFISLSLMPMKLYADWNVDFTRRQNQMAKPAQMDMQPDVKVDRAEEKNIFDRAFNTVVPAQEIVILNTEQGFVPSTVRVKEGAQYKIVVVNVNEKSRNVSFVLDSFSEHHATFYGKLKSFYISPKKEGVYTFMSPETSAQGRLVVHPGIEMNSNLDVRLPASE